MWVTIHRIPCAANDLRYAVFTVPFLSRFPVISGIRLDSLLSVARLLLDLLPSPVSTIWSLLRLLSSLVGPKGSRADFRHCLGPQAPKASAAGLDWSQTWLRRSETCETPIRTPRHNTTLVGWRITWNGPFQLMPQIHFIPIHASNRCGTTNLATMSSLDIGCHAPESLRRPRLRDKKYLAGTTNQR